MSSQPAPHSTSRGSRPCAKIPFGYTSDRVERMRAGLHPEPQPPTRVVTNRDVIDRVFRDLAVAGVRGGAAVVSFMMPFVVAYHRWLNSPANPPDQR